MMSNRFGWVAEKLRRALVPAAIGLLLLLMLARATRPTAAVQSVDEETAGQSAADIRADGERGLFQSVIPTPTWTNTPTNTPVATATNTPTNTPAPTATNTPTNTPAPTATNTPTNTPAPTATNTPTPTPTPLPPLTVGDLTVVDPPAGIVEKDVEIFAVVVFTDPAVFDHSAQWYWGDGTSDPQSNVDSPVQASHAYAEPGLYKVEVTITNSNGEFERRSYESVVVYDPSDGFVTGGGWIESPAGAYTYDSSLAGKATFAFVSKYTKGKQTPSGHTEFKFKAAGFEFSSDHYYWLVVKGNGEALFSGSGTINGQLAPNGDPYKFTVWANDDDPDTFRIRIWWEEFDAAATEHVVYDNGAQQAIGGGSIVIHSGKSH